MTTQASSASAKAAAARFREVHTRVRSEVHKAIVGQESVIDSVLTALFAGGHVLLEGVPGIGKTLLVHSLGEALDLKFSRIQFTPDLMPSDVRGAEILVQTRGGGHELRFQPGPIVSNLVLADEINRATPKTQSAMLEAMQERQVTIGERTIKLEEPYCVMATQNPVEQEGTYPLPEAQLDRFLLKVVVGYPKEDEYGRILALTTGVKSEELSAVSNGPEVLEMREIVREVPVPEVAQQHAVRLVMATQPDSEYAPELVKQAVALGSSPRGAQALILAAKVNTLLAGRYAVAPEDIRAVAMPCLRHRVLLSFQGQADGVSADQVVQAVLEAMPLPGEGL
jgi:MoxR-like ATPase